VVHPAPCSIAKFRLNLFIGIDIGTSGCRAVAINESGDEFGHISMPLPMPIHNGQAVQQNPEIWWQVVIALLQELLATIDPRSVQAIAVDGTSATLLLTDIAGQPLAPALMYNDLRAINEAAEIAAIAPPDSAVQSAGSSLAKLLWLKAQNGMCKAHYALHQADWITGKLCGQFGFSDSNNSLKLGYDPVNQCWPKWLDRLNVPRHLLPKILDPGTPAGYLDTGLADKLGLPSVTRVVMGTTDSTAAIIATGAIHPGNAVTSLGSTLVIKIITEQPFFCSRYGIYSQPLGPLWLVGGASNSGGAVLRQFFTIEQMVKMSEKLNPQRRTCLEYYPLPATGERFPVYNPGLEPRLSPRPKDDLRFFQGMLEGIARIEQRGYRLLAELGTPYPATVRTVGGGAANKTWEQIRSQFLGIPMIRPVHSEAAYGAALLARAGSRKLL